MKLPGSDTRWGGFLRTLSRRWNEDSLSDVAGAVTFASVLSLFPFLLFVVEVGSRFINPVNEAEIIDRLSRLAPAPVTELIAHRIRSLALHESTGLATFAIVGSLWTASSGLMTLMGALNTCYGVPETRPYWKRRLGAILLTFFAVILSILASAVAVALPALTSKLGPVGHLVGWLRLPASALLVMFLWAALYWLLPDQKRPFKLITPGSVAGVLLWLVVSWGFSLYIAHFNRYEVTYGALGGVAILLLWMWLSAQALLLGAEINAIIDNRGGHPPAVNGRRKKEAREPA